jgi:anionic cell wall polymer biosynthesis LytR-Cps2A-Psr (LCP) family protein
MSLDLLPSLPGLIDALGGMVETNIPLDRQLALAQLGYDIKASDIMTTTIDSSMIEPITLNDGSEGLKLDNEVAQPVLNSFFGWGSQDAGNNAVNAPGPQPTASKGSETRVTPGPTRDGSSATH